MAIWTSEIKELEKLHESVEGQLPDLEKELEHLIKADDENMILLYSRRCLEVIITDLCACELKRDRGSEPLKGIIDKLHKEKKISANIIASMHGLNELSTFGTHPKDFDPEQVKPVLVNLDIIIKWYLKYKHIALIQITGTEEQKVQQREQPSKEIRGDERKEVQNRPSKIGEQRLISIIALASILIIAAILIYPRIFKRDSLEKLRSSGDRISVAVMPFMNMTNDTTWNVWQDGIQDILINSLSNSKEFIVRQPESIYNLVKSQGIVNYASLTPSVASTISQKLDVNIFIYGNIKQSGNIIRLYAQLIDTETKEVFKSFQVEGPSKDEMVFNIIDSLSVLVRNFLIISELAKELPSYSYYDATLTSSPEALRYFIYGRNDFIKLKYPSARNWLFQAISLDSNFVHAIIQLSLSFKNQNSYEQAKKWCMKAYEKRDHMTPQLKIRSNYLYSGCFETPHEQIIYLNELLDFDDQNPITYFNLGNCYNDLFQYDKAIPEYEKALEIHEKWGTKPFWVLNYVYLGNAYHKTGQYKKEKKLYEKAIQDFPNELLQILRNQGVLALAEGDTAAFRKIGEQALSILKNRSFPEADRVTAFASVREDGNDLDNAELYFRQALSLEPENPVRLNNLAYFLINKDRNINEGLELAEKVLELSPDDYASLHSKGWGLFQEGKYQEALEILQKSWDLRMKNAVYDHEAFLHLEEAKKAVAEQKNN